MQRLFLIFWLRFLRIFFSHLLVFMILAVFLIGTVSTARADIAYSGNVDPDNPNTWTMSTWVEIGYVPTEEDPYNGFGSVTVSGGSGLLSYGCYIGSSSGST